MKEIIFIEPKWPEDCIHLHACRRFSKILRDNGIIIARGCTQRCTAYCSGKKRYVAVSDGEQAVQTGRRHKGRIMKRLKDKELTLSDIVALNEVNIF